MPELPEIEVLVRQLRPLLRGKTIHGVDVRRAKVLSPTALKTFQRALIGAKFTGLSRRGKYLLFQLHSPSAALPFTLLGHLGMTGRMFLAKKNERPIQNTPRWFLIWAADNFIYEDPRYFGRLTLDTAAIEKLGPEPLSDDFQPAKFRAALRALAAGHQGQTDRPDVSGGHRQHLRERGALSAPAFRRGWRRTG